RARCARRNGCASEAVACAAIRHRRNFHRAALATARAYSLPLACGQTGHDGRCRCLTSEHDKGKCEWLRPTLRPNPGNWPAAILARRAALRLKMSAPAAVSWFANDGRSLIDATPLRAASHDHFPT